MCCLLKRDFNNIVMVKLECAGKLIDSIDFISNYLMKLIHGLNGKDKLYQKKLN